MLTIKHNGTDLSREQARFEFLDSELDFAVAPLYIGYYKPVSSIYLNLVANTGTRTLAVDYWNGTAWTSVSGLTELTFGLTKPAFVSWAKNLTNESKTTVNSSELFWYRLTPSDAPTVTFRGISALFSDDFDLIGVYPTILDHLPQGQATFVRFHEEAAKDIINDLKRTGIVVNGRLSNGTERKQLDAFDLLDKEEVRDASKYFALSKIFSWLSDEVGDKWDALAAKYEAEAAGSLTPLISIDNDDDGKQDEDEKVQDSAVYIGRL